MILFLSAWTRWDVRYLTKRIRLLGSLLTKRPLLFVPPLVRSPFVFVSVSLQLFLYVWNLWILWIRPLRIRLFLFLLKLFLKGWAVVHLLALCLISIWHSGSIPLMLQLLLLILLLLRRFIKHFTHWLHWIVSLAPAILLSTGMRSSRLVVHSFLPLCFWLILKFGEWIRHLLHDICPWRSSWSVALITRAMAAQWRELFLISLLVSLRHRELTLRIRLGIIWPKKFLTASMLSFSTHSLVISVYFHKLKN